MQYAAFLLGINVGKRTVKMGELKALMQKEGYTDVGTVLASGNVIFSAPAQKPETLEKKLERAYEKKFGFTIGVIARSMREIEAMLSAQPFKKVKMTKDIRRYVTFLAEARTGAAPKSDHDGYVILKAGKRETYSVLDLSKFAKTPDIMALLGKAYGKKITTRNWNTIEKIAALGDAS